MLARSIRGLRPIRSLNYPVAISTGSEIAMLNELISSERDGRNAVGSLQPTHQIDKTNIEGHRAVDR